MAKTVVGLFDSIDDAQSVSSELRSVRGTDVNLVSRDVYGGSDSDIMNMVTGAGVPSSDANLYVQGVRQGSTLVVAQTDDAQVGQVVDIMNRHNIVDIDSRRSMYSGSDATIGASADVTRATLSTSDMSYVDTTPATNVDTSYTTGAVDTTRTNTVNTGDEIAVPIVEEQLRVGKREVETGGVRVNTRVEEVPVEQQVTLRDEEVRVERRAVNQPVSPNDMNAFQEGTIEIRETDEEAIVAKEARVVEEVVIRKEAEEHVETVRDTVRRTDVDVQQVPGTTSTSGVVETGRVSASDVSTTGSTLGTTGSTLGTTGSTGTTGGGLTDRIEGATGLDVDRDGDVSGSTRRR
jgi:uncharacterized protein (TIGR02271 family)